MLNFKIWSIIGEHEGSSVLELGNFPNRYGKLILVNGI